MSISIRHARTRPASYDVLAVAVTEEDRDDVLDAEGPGAAYAEGRGFTAQRAQTLVVPGEAGTSTLFVGLGAASSVDPVAVRRAVVAAVRATTRHERLVLDVVDRLPEGVDRSAATSAVAEGVLLGAYRFDAHRGSPPPAKLRTVRVVAASGAGVAAALTRGQAIAEAVCWARDLVNEPGGSMTPKELAAAVRSMGRRAGLKVSILDEAAIRKAGMGGLLGVNRGSEQPPRFVKVSYSPAGASSGTVALVGKGITFDSGGLSIKTADGMKTMKDDMAGGAAVLAAMSVLPALEVGATVHAYVPLTDNMTGGDATRPGDILTICDGTTVEVLNTDAEGRLVLADALVTAVRDEPDAVIDLATLTGACMVALGRAVAGLMGRGDRWLEQVEAASARTGEPVWRLPLPDDMRPQIDSKVADLKNIASAPYGGALIAGLFLQEFVGDEVPWAHVDIAGPAWCDDATDESAAGGTGFGVRLLVDLLENVELPVDAP